MTRKKILTMVVFLAMAYTFSPTRGNAQQRFAGSQTCAQCHDDISDKLLETPHGASADPRSPAVPHGCETCHGPGSAHSESQGEEKITSLKHDSTTPGAINAVCLSCHTKSPLTFWHGGTHEQRGLSCTTCHGIHGNSPRCLVKEHQADVCTPCHKEIRPQLLRQSHHPLREGAMTCSDCHNPHGSVEDHLIESRTVNLTCYECHAEKRGPYLWEHPPVTENCLTCHTPHGSSHAHLLNGKVPYLCQRCHSNPTHNSNVYAQRPDQRGTSAYRSMNNRAFYRACLNCHGTVHGSNHPSGNLLLR